MRDVTFWLLPTPRVAGELAGVMETLRHVGVGAFRETLHAPFAPHVTLGSTEVPAATDVGQVLAAIGRSRAPLTLEVSGTISAPDPEAAEWTLWRSLALDLEPHPGLAALAEEVGLRLGAVLERPEVPHLSLHYSQLSRAAKLRLLEGLGPPDLIHRWPTLEFDRLAVVDAGREQRADMQRIAGWAPAFPTPLLGQA
jgi:2'-5' RNA ligase